MPDRLIRLDGENHDPPTLYLAHDNGDGSFSTTVWSGGVVQVPPVTITRPADTNAYIANDALANATSAATLASFAAGRTPTGGGIIVGLTLQCNNVNAVNRTEVDIYNASITALNDNAEATRLNTNASKYVGSIVLPALAKKTANSDQVEAVNFDVRLPYQCAAGGLLYFTVRFLDAFTPLSATTHVFTFWVVQA